MRTSPVHLLLWLLALAVGVSGWIYGWKWKRVMSGGKPTAEEKIIMELQDQLDLLRSENDRLAALVNAAPAETGNTENSSGNPSTDAGEPVELPSQK